VRERTPSVAVWAALLLLAAVWLGRPRAWSPPGEPPAMPPTGAARLLHGLRIDPAREGAEVLEVLPGIGPGRAQAIVRERNERPLCRVADLLRVPGIGPVTLERIAGHLEIGPQTACASLSSRADALSGRQESSHERTGTSGRGHPLGGGRP